MLNFNLVRGSVAETRQLITERDALFGRGLNAALKANGATAVQRAAVKALIGTSTPVGAPIASNVFLRRYGQDRMLAGLIKLVQRDERGRAVYRRYLLDTADNDGRLASDFKMHRQALQPHLKRDFTDFVARFRPAIVDGELRMTLGVLGWVLATEPGSTAKTARKRRGSETPVAVADLTFDNLNDADDLARGCAMLWEANPQGDVGPFEAGGDFSTPTVSPEHHQHDLRVMVVLASTTIGRDMFGHGGGKLLGKCCTREIVARALSLDIAAESPLQTEGIAAFLAELPSSREGKKLPLPTLKQL